METIMTYHCGVERANRVQNIVEKIGMGQIVKEKFVRGCYTCITDTGITIVKSADKTKVVTMYVTTYRELVSIYDGTKKFRHILKRKSIKIKVIIPPRARQFGNKKGKFPLFII